MSVRHMKLPLFDRVSERVTRIVGSSASFAAAVLLVVSWALIGPLAGFSETWQLVINTTTTIITFLVVFIIQHSQNKSSDALHLKLNELLASHREASNRVIGIEDLSQSELMTLRRFYQQLSKLAEEHGPIKETHSLDEAADTHKRKQRASRK